ncbi:MAG: Tat pathway signal sequence domain protein [Kiloniellales bacterium]|nr:Tat pathway signal sequence domain protein [Kiloniellales bacterium]
MAMTTRTFCLVFLWLLFGSAAAQAQSAITLDLNKLEPRENACRAYFILENATESQFSGFTLDLYIFDSEGIIAKRLVVDTAPLIPAKTRIRPVDIREMACDQVSKIVVNDVIDCKDGSGERKDCVTQLGLTNRTAAEFGM